ncbi:5'-nucleotidase, lipoprotein e(P4) family [Roseateles chitinivorans]|uniref:5'-nucleotidase, lipoprotein e(P4) family n=1 Tax=Roseateles chitinivorans TaxID=2917965 RepID=UPI003D67529B
MRLAATRPRLTRTTLTAAVAMSAMTATAWMAPSTTRAASAAESASASTEELPVVGREGVTATLWLQTAVERRAATLAVYRAATARLPSARKATHETASLEQAAEGSFARKPPAIVLDVDETVVDNSPYEAWRIQAGKPYDSASWAAWVASAQATAIPGAPEFIARARALGFRVVFITNRTCPADGPFGPDGLHAACPQKAQTLVNLERVLGRAVAPDDLMLRGDRADWSASDKSARRLAVARTHRIAMLVGDDLNDFAPRATYDEQAHAKRWGLSWVPIPNPTYGSWGDALTLPQRYQALKPWSGPTASESSAP